MTGQREPARWQRRLPNQLTGARVALALVFFGVLAPFEFGSATWRGDALLPLLGAGLFIVAAVTDAMDGYLARKWGVVSVFGRVMDPFADKILVLGAFVMLAGPGFVDVSRVSQHEELALDAITVGIATARPPTVSGVTSWMVVLILGRELLVTSLRGLVESRGGDFSATTSGKLKMILQCVAAPAILLLVALQCMRFRAADSIVARADRQWFMNPAGWCAILAWLTMLVTVWSAVPYVTRAVRALREPQAGSR